MVVMLVAVIVVMAIVVVSDANGGDAGSREALDILQRIIKLRQYFEGRELSGKFRNLRGFIEMKRAVQRAVRR